MNYTIIAYLLLALSATQNSINAMIAQGAVLNFENLAHLAETYCNNNAAIEATAPSTDTAYTGYPDGAKKLVNSNKINANQKILLAALVDDDNGIEKLVNEYLDLPKNKTLKSDLKIQPFGHVQLANAPVVKKYINDAAKITKLIEFLEVFISVDESTFKLNLPINKNAYESEIETIDKALEAKRATKPKKITTISTTTTSIEWLNDLETFFTQEISGRSATSQKYTLLIQSIRGLATTPPNAPTVIDSIVNELSTTSAGDDKYLETVATEFQALSEAIQPTQFKKIFGGHYEKLKAMAPYLNEQALRKFYEVGNQNAGGTTEKNAIKNIINLALLKIALKKIMANIESASSVPDVKNLYNSNKKFFAYAKKDTLLSQDVTNFIKKVTTGKPWILDEWTDLQAQDIATKETKLITF